MHAAFLVISVHPGALCKNGLIESIPLFYVSLTDKGKKRVYIHTTASWPGRDDRRAALVWLAMFWIFVGVGFGFDLHNYLQEQPPVPTIVHVHAIATN